MMSLSNSHSPDDQLLVRYLVGSLTEDETERLDELSVADDQFAAHLRAVENDLVDAYVKGELSGDTLNRFNTHYLSTPALRDKVTFAEALLRYQRRAAAAPAFTARGRRWFGVPRVVPHWGWAVAALLFLGATGSLVVENNRLRHEMIAARAARAAVEAREQELQRQVTEQRSANAETARELAQIRESLAQRPAAAAPNQPAGGTVIASFVLLPPKRGGGDIPTIRLPSATPAVTLHVDLEADEFPIYRAQLNDPATAQIIWSGANLRAARRGGARSLSITLDASVLKPQTYIVDVIGVPARGAPESVASYPFRVEKLEIRK
jgi:hypothetical protein